MTKENKWQEERDRLQSILQNAGLTETIKWGTQVYTRNGRNVVSFGGFKNHFALVFFDGFLLKDKYKVLVSGQEGVTKAMRQWRFTSMDQIDEKRILEYVAEATANADDGKGYKPEKSEKSKPAELPQLLADGLKKDGKLKAAFGKLAPYQQKLYAEHIASAKQEATKLKRLEKITPMILQGIGLHDKYKNG